MMSSTFCSTFQYVCGGFNWGYVVRLRRGRVSGRVEATGVLRPGRMWVESCVGREKEEAGTVLRMGEVVNSLFCVVIGIGEESLCRKWSCECHCLVRMKIGSGNLFLQSLHQGISVQSFFGTI